MSDWDASDNENDAGAVSKAAPAVVPKKSKWDDEEEDSEIAEDWDVSEDEDAKPGPPTSAPVAPPKKKGTLKQKLAEKEAARAARIEAGEESEDELDEREKRRLAKERELEADLRNATELLGATKLNGSSAAAPPELQELISMNPTTKDDFARLSALIMEHIIRKHESKPLFATFVEMHVRELAQSMRDVDVRKAASALTTLANEKQKEKTGAGKKKGKATAKPVLGAAKVINRIDTAVYDEALDDFGKEPDDFM